MPKVKIFVNTNAQNLEHDINQWIDENEIPKEGFTVSYSAHEEFIKSSFQAEAYRLFFSALVTYYINAEAI